MMTRRGEPRDANRLLRMRAATLWASEEPQRARPRCERCVSHDATLVRIEEYENVGGGVLTRHIALFTALGRLYSRTDETHHLILYEPSSITALPADTGFAWQRLPAYQD